MALRDAGSEAAMWNIILCHWSIYLYLTWLLVIVLANIWMSIPADGTNGVGSQFRTLEHQKAGASGSIQSRAET